MRLAFISSSFPPYTSGVGVNAATITSGLADKGHEVGAFIPDYDHSKIRQSGLVSPRVRLFSLPSIRNPLKRTHRLMSLSHKSLILNLKSFNPDVIHLQEPLAYQFPAVSRWARNQGIPLVCAHHFPPQFITNQLPRPFRAGIFNDLIVYSVVSLYNQTRLVITPTYAMEKLLKSHGLKVPVSVISNGVDTRKYSPQKTKSQPVGLPVALYLGRIDFDKNLDTLVQAARFLHTPCEIWFAGGGKAVNYLTSLAAKISNPRSQIFIKFPGYVPEDKKADTYRRASLFIMPSTAEAQSIVSLEAATCGVPLILADAAALPELISPDHPNGLLFTPGDPVDLAAKIDTLLSDPKRLSDMGTNSRRLAEIHDITKVINRYEQTYLGLIQSEGNR